MAEIAVDRPRVSLRRRRATDIPTVVRRSTGGGPPQRPNTPGSISSNIGEAFDRLLAGDRRSVERRIMMALLVLALATGAVLATGENRIFGAVVALAIMGLTVYYPPFGAWVLVGATPFVVGVPRNLYMPLLRPNEVFLALVVIALAVRWLIWSRKFTFRINKFEMATLLFVFTGSILPMVFTYGRLRPLNNDDIFYSITLWKFLAIYLIVRLVIKTPSQVRELLWVTLLASSAIGAMAVIDSRNTFNFAFTLAAYFPPGQNIINDGRGAATIGNPIGLGGYMAIHAFIAFAMLIKGERPIWLLGPIAFITVLGTMGSGQTSGLIALLAGAVGVAIVSRSVGKILMYGIPILMVVSFMVYPVIEARVVGLSNDGTLTSYQRDGIANIPPADQPEAMRVTNPGSSWDVRAHNLRTFFLPQFKSLNDWFFGVSPQARVPQPDVGGDFQWIWIESGHLWLFWIGGLPLFLGFMFFMYYGAKTMWRLSREREGPAQIAAIASFGAFCSLFVNQTFDPHITLRGTADIFWPLLALAVVGAPSIKWFPEGKSRYVDDGRGMGYSTLLVESPAAIRRRETLTRLQPNKTQRFLKRTVDIVASSLGLLVLAIPLLIIMAIIRLTSKGPAIFTQERVGVLEKPFTIYKLRTMAANNDDSEHREFVKKQLLDPNATADTEDGAFKLVDSRVTPIGSFLRRLSLDELPQLYNVLKGDMSLIGPRPALPWEVELFAPQHRMRSLVKPGCTGLWQVSGRNKLTSLQMLDLDVDYASQVNLFRDLGILIKTPMVLVRGDGAR